MSDPRIDVTENFAAGGSTAAILAEREIDTGGRNLRQHAARGAMINSAFQVGLAGVGLMRRVLVAAFLTQAEFGIWGILVSTLITLSWLKQVGISDKYIQQVEADQEAAYQKAFTLELALSMAFFVLVVALLPLYALAYGRVELIVPGIVLAMSVPISAFQAPAWIAYRRMQFVHQRLLTAVDPLVAFVVTIIFGVLGFGYWCLVIGAVAGSITGSLVATITSPYRPHLRFDRSSLGEYTRFSSPLIGLALSNLIVIQGVLLIANHSIGLAGVGTIGLAVTIASFADRVNGIVNQTIYPAVCAVAHRNALLHEAFVKSNRITLMWAIPFGVGLALFAGDLVTFVLGERWRDSVGLLTAVGLIAGVGQVAFNWSVFMRAVNDTKPLFKASLVNLGMFLLIMAPALWTLGLTGYAIGLGATAVVQLLVRGYFIGRLFAGFKVLRHLVRAIAPSVPAAAVVLLVRLLVDGARSLPVALGELVLYTLATIAFTLIFERRLLSELVSYLRGAGEGWPARAAPQGASRV